MKWIRKSFSRSTSAFGSLVSNPPASAADNTADPNDPIANEANVPLPLALIPENKLAPGKLPNLKPVPKPPPNP